MSETTGQASPQYAQYSNFFQVGFNAFEFLIDFGQDYGEGTPGVHTRIVTSATHARTLIASLQNSLLEYDRRYTDEQAEE